MKTLTRQQAKEFYDRFGGKQDWQAFYEGRPIRALIRNGKFEDAAAVFEFGCGTGRLAETLLERHLAPSAMFVGVDASETMVSLSKKRLSRFGRRATVKLTDGSPRLDFGAAAFDRFVSCYVFDLMALEEIRNVLVEAHRILSGGGLLCLISLTHGFTGVSRIVERAWQAVFNIQPDLVGGCRPIDLAELVSEPVWHIRHDDKISSFGVPSEVLIAERATDVLPCPPP
jgi:ubiquinone/menaquinone biosynthesis C-methylase UbiE